MKKVSWFSQQHCHHNHHSSYFPISKSISILAFIVFISFLDTTCFATTPTPQTNFGMKKFPNYKNRFALLSSTQRLGSLSSPIISHHFPQSQFQVIRHKQEDEESGEGLRHQNSHEEMQQESRNENEPATSQGEEFEKEQEENLSPIEQAIQQLSSPEKLLPVINNLTFIALVLLHLPAIVPTILIPLAFFCVGSLLIPIVRVNYFINHKDDGEDGRRNFGASWGHHFFNLFIKNLLSFS